MKRLSYYAPALALAAVLALSGAAFALSPAAKNTTITAATSARDHYQMMYYWYDDPGDYYDQYATITDEENELYILYGGYVIDTNPIGGTVVAEGYLNNNYPHTQYPSAYLYIHYY
jgi:hypothetical protein